MAVGTTGVFVTEETDALFHFHFNKCNLLNSVEVYNDLDSFRNSIHSHKISCLQMPYPVRAEFDTLVDDLVSCSDHVLILMSELHDRTVEIVQRHDDRKISYFICGEFNFDLTFSPVHKFYDWFTTTTHFYKHVRPDTLDVLDPYITKPYYFDALLGRKKMHRDYAFKHIDTKVNLVTYLGDIICNFDDPDKWIWEDDGLVIDKTVEWTVDRLPYYGHRMSISQIVPLQIYNQTVYTLVAETNFSNHYSFYTEKSVKPILARRLFVTLGGQNQLANLRKLGFRTFGNVIDESYDDVEANLDRFQLALDQVAYLQTQDQEEILAKIKPICEHNRNLMLSTDWYNSYFKSAFVSYFNQ
jgi:hypothetical protein